jgi:hypothetical protein
VCQWAPDLLDEGGIADEVEPRSTTSGHSSYSMTSCG